MAKNIKAHPVIVNRKCGNQVTLADAAFDLQNRSRAVQFAQFRAENESGYEQAPAGIASTQALAVKVRRRVLICAETSTDDLDVQLV
jgi:hypothetical protein